MVTLQPSCQCLNILYLGSTNFTLTIAFYELILWKTISNEEIRSKMEDRGDFISGYQKEIVNWHEHIKGMNEIARGDAVGSSLLS